MSTDPHTDPTRSQAPPGMPTINHLHRKALWFAMVISMVFALLGSRLFYIQYLRHGYFSRVAEDIHTATVTVAPQRGDIRTRDGKLVARSVACQSVFVDPSKLENRQVREQVSIDLARALDMDRIAIYNEISDRLQKKFIWIKRRISVEEERRMAEVIEAKTTGVGLKREWRRIFPMGSEAAHLVGMVNIDNLGTAGLELTHNQVLTGRGRNLAVNVDVHRNLIPRLGGIDGDGSEFGCSLELTIDSRVQHFVEVEVDKIQETYDPVGIVAIAMDVTTGEVLGYACRPTFDPNDPTATSPASWTNAGVSHAYEIGSVFKPFVMAAALQEGVVDVGDKFYCHDGLFRHEGRSLHDHHPYGWLTAPEVIWKSSNIGMALVGLKLGNERMHRYLESFGFGKPTGIDLPGESPGRMAPVQQWTSYTTTSIPMGHEIMVTPLQVVTAFSALVNGGYLLEPKIVRRVMDAEGRVVDDRTCTDPGRQVISNKVSRLMMHPFLSGVVYRGTGKKAQSSVYTLGGKSGTGQKVVDGRYSHSKFVSSFICAGPVEDPRICVLVVVDEPRKGGSHYGGTVAAPGAGRILHNTLEFYEVRPGTDPGQLTGTLERFAAQ